MYIMKLLSILIVFASLSNICFGSTVNKVLTYEMNINVCYVLSNLTPYCTYSYINYYVIFGVVVVVVVVIVATLNYYYYL